MLSEEESGLLEGVNFHKSITNWEMNLEITIKAINTYQKSAVVFLDFKLLACIVSLYPCDNPKGKGCLCASLYQQTKSGS